MPTADTALVYPGGCLLEGTNLSEGRGTTRPFELVGAPWLDGRALAAGLASTGAAGLRRAAAHRSSPTFQKHAGKICGGVQIHVTDPRALPPGTRRTSRSSRSPVGSSPSSFRFRTERYEYVDTIPAFDLLTGSAAARLAIEAGEDPLAIAVEVSRADPAWPEVMREAQAAVSASGSRPRGSAVVAVVGLLPGGGAGRVPVPRVTSNAARAR